MKEFHTDGGSSIRCVAPVQHRKALDASPASSWVYTRLAFPVFPMIVKPLMLATVERTRLSNREENLLIMVRTKDRRIRPRLTA